MMNREKKNRAEATALKDQVREIAREQPPRAASIYDEDAYWILPGATSLEECARILDLKPAHLPLVRWATRALGWPIQEEVNCYYKQFPARVPETGSAFTCMFVLVRQPDSPLLFQFYIYDPAAKEWPTLNASPRSPAEIEAVFNYF